MNCDVCGHGGAKTKHISRSYGKGEDRVVIDDIPVVVCPNCGESYMTADTMHEVQRFKLIPAAGVARLWADTGKADQ